MTRRGLMLAFAISLSAVTGAGTAHADTCTGGTYRIDGLFGTVPYVRMGGSRTVDNVLHLDAPDQSASAFDITVVPIRQQDGYTPGPAPSVQMSLDGGPTHSFSFTWRPSDRNGNLGTWNSDWVEFGALTRGTHVLHQTLSVPAGNPEGIYELGQMAHMEGSCPMVTVTESSGFSVWFTSGDPAQPSTPAAGGGTTRKPTPRATPTGIPEPSPSPTTDTPSPTASATPTPTPTVTAPLSASPTPTTAPSPTAVPLAATPAAHGSSALPWLLGAPAAAALMAGGVLVLRRRRAAAEPGEPLGPVEPAAEGDGQRRY